MASSQRFNNSVSNNSTQGISQFSIDNLTENNSENQHFLPNWTSLSFLDDSNDELSEAAADFEVAKNAKVFDPVVGGRNSTRSSSSRSSGSTGCSDQALESSPTNSLSPYAFVSSFITITLLLREQLDKSQHLSLNRQVFLRVNVIKEYFYQL